MVETGVAFSGGGIRSAAFCSGVLRRLLQRNTKIDYLSCVSGGGYTGTAYLDWKFRNENKDDPKWHQEFFDHMRERAGYMCNWQKPLQGIFDTIMLLTLMLFVSIVMPVIVWGCNICPLAYAVDFLFGNLLRAENEECDDTTQAAGNPTQATNSSTRCSIEAGSRAYDRIVLFSILAVLFVFFFLLARGWRAGVFATFYIVSAVCGLLFAFTFIPYYIFYFFNFTPIWAQLLVFIFSIFVWFFFPVLRSKASLVVVVYVYAYGVYWRVFRATTLGVEYSDHLFYRLLFASGIVFWIVPALGALQQRLIYVLNR